MEIKCRVLDPQEYEKAVTLNQTKGTQGINKAGLLWQYHSSNLPFDGAIVGAFDGDRLVGTQAFIPVKSWYKSEEILSAKSEYTLVDPEYRGQKVFEKMYEVGFDWVESHGIQCIWGFTGATKAFARVGFDIGDPLCVENIVYKPLNYYKKVTIAREKSLEEKVPSFKNVNQGDFGLVRDEAYLSYRYLENPYRQVVHHDSVNGVLYSESASNPGYVYVSEVEDYNRLLDSIRSYSKQFSKSTVVLKRLTMEPQLKPSLALPRLYRKQVSGNQLVFWWGKNYKERCTPQFKVDEGYSQGVN